MAKRRKAALSGMKSMKKALASSKKRRLPSSCDVFVRDMEQVFFDARAIKSKKLRAAAMKAADKAAERGIKAGCCESSFCSFYY